MKVVNHSDEFNVSGSTGPVRLTMSYGDGQDGTALVTKNGTVIVGGADLANVLLGNAEDLAGQTVIVRSTIGQTDKSTQHFSAVHDVFGSAVHEQFIVADVFDTGTSAVVVETITFK